MQPVSDAPSHPPGVRRFAGVILVDPRGWLLLQERDEHPVIDPDRWGLPGGHVEPGETFAQAAHRELAEETGVELAAGDLAFWGEFRVDHRHAYGTFDQMQVFVAPTLLTDEEIDCREGRRIVFVEPRHALGLELTSAASVIVPAFLSSPAYASMAP
ncbi:NUDIX domain-containing protein [Nocardioides sp. 616]|uniref:NUDIX domain-containing protein n=1 Tax=Nocardioides sp. 616 TaxID=2268090 RepID=UPI000CE543FE|nr:NUDIX domain-containing protein [Nocardioides sp. 616]